jgi:hypothetical protein
MNGTTMTLSCKDLTHLVSQSMDESLPWRKRMAMRFHLMICYRCRVFRRQMEGLRRMMGGLQRSVEEGEACQSLHLSDAARARIREELEKERRP